MAESNTAPFNRLGRRNIIAEAMFAPLENPTATSDRHHELGELISPAPQVVLIEDSLPQSTKESRHTVLQDRPAHREHRGPRRKMIT
jgi:hypothetical protein